MPKLPILKTTTPDDRERFLRAVKAAGFDWCGGPITDEKIKSARRDNSFICGHLWRDTKKSVRFIEGQNQYDDYMGTGDYIHVNSPAHFIACARRLAKHPV